MIDWTRVRELRDEIGDDDFGEVVVLFLQEADEVIARLGRNGRQRSVVEDLHFLKGAALNLGFRDLAGSCSEAERLIAADQSIDLAAIAARFLSTRTAFMNGLETALEG